MDVTRVRTPAPWAEFGEALRQRRRHLGLTQAQIGSRVGYHHTLISKLEGGAREPSPGLARRLDDLLGTGGELAAIYAKTSRPQRAAPAGSAERASHSSLFPIPGGGTDHDVTAGNGLAWPSRLPCHWLPCPLHGDAGCAVPGPAESLAAYHRICTADRVGPASRAIDLDTAHGLIGLLAAHVRTSVERISTDIITSIEQVLRGIVRWMESGGGHHPVLLRIAASYAQVAGEVRLERGQNGIAMAWLDKGLQWAIHAEDTWLRVTTLCDMSMLARLDRDGLSALAYAEAIGAVNSQRRWIATLADLNRARAYALAGDTRECQRHADRARASYTRLGDDDRAAWWWFSGSAGHAHVEGGVGAAFRDMAAATGNQPAARLAVQAFQRSLAHIPAHVRPLRLACTIRLADSYACAGEPDAAIATADPVLAEAVAGQGAIITAELSGLRSRLLSNWGGLPVVRDFAERVYAGRA